MRFFRVFLLLMLAAAFLFAQEKPSQTAAPPTYTLTVHVDGVNSEGGNIGVLVFNNDKGWPEDRFAALKDIVVDAHPGTVIVKIPDLPAGNYALAIAHDVNKNHKVDKNWIGKPKEQWGMSNNPHGLIKAPAFSKAEFKITADTDIHVELQ